MMYIKNGSVKKNIDHVITASLRDSLDGEVSLTLSLDASYREYITDGTVIENDDYYFDVASYEYRTLGDTYTVYIAADHVSCRLNTSFGEGGFAMQGTPAQILAAILSGSDFTVGTVEDSTVYTVAIHGNTYRKNAIIQLANLCGCEIVYSGFKIGLVKRRGSDVPYELTEENILIGIDYSRDVVNDTERYILDIGQLGGLEVGQTVNVVYHPYGIDGKTARVLSVEYNPYDKFEAVVEVGDYTPDITGEMLGQANEFNKAKWEFEANDERLLSRITDAEGRISTVSQTANKINWLVKSGTSASNFTLTDRMVTLISDNITLKGKTIALTADSINITSTHFNVATSGAVNCTSLAVTGNSSSINIIGNAQNSALIKTSYYSDINTYSYLSPYIMYINNASYSGNTQMYAQGFITSAYENGYFYSTNISDTTFSMSNNYTGRNVIYASAVLPGWFGNDQVIIGGDLAVYGTKPRVEQTEHYGDRLMYAFESPNPLYSDFGRATIADDGLCYVFLDPVFYECIDNNYDYFVFIQPENSGEFAVIERTSDHFTVQGTPGKSFAWMLVTAQKGYSATRTEELVIPEPEPAQTPDPENAVYDAVGDEILKEFENQLG